MTGCFTRVRRLGRDLETLSAAQRHTTRCRIRWTRHEVSCNPRTSNPLRPAGPYRTKPPIRDTASPSWYNKGIHAAARFIQTSIRLQKKRRAQEEPYEGDYHRFVLGTFLAALHRQCAGSPWQGRIPRGETTW